VPEMEKGERKEHLDPGPSPITAPSRVTERR